MCCEGTAVGFKLPEDGVNKHHACRKRDKYVSEEIRCGSRQVVSKDYFIESSQLFSLSVCRNTDCGFCKITVFGNNTYRSQTSQYI